MAVGKNKRLARKGKKKQVNPFTLKDWYDIRAPCMFRHRTVGKTLITKTRGTKISSECMKGRVFEVSLADLNKDEDLAYRKIKLIAQDVQGDKVLTSFYGMDFTRDKLCSLIKKWQTLVEARVDVKTTDGYTLRMFCIGFTKKRQNQVKKTCYAQATQVKAIRKKMEEVMLSEASSCDLKQLVEKFIPAIIGKEVEKACTGIYPLQNCYVRKVKMLKMPKFDLTKLMEMHAEDESTAEEAGAPVTREDETPATEVLAGSGGRL